MDKIGNTECTLEDALAAIRLLNERLDRQELLLEQLFKSIPVQLTSGWIPSSPNSDLDAVSRATPKVKKIEILDTNPSELVDKLRSSIFGRIYITKLKRFTAIRWIVRRVWRYGYPAYVNHVVVRFFHSKTARWRTLTALGVFIKSEKFPVHKLIEAVVVETAAPSVFPGAGEESLVIPHSYYRFPEISVSVVSNAFIYGGTNLFLSDDCVVCHDLYDFTKDFTSEELHGRVLIDPELSRIRWLVNDHEPVSVHVAAVFVDACAANYAHWMTEVLPRIFLFCSDDEFYGIPVVVNGGLHRNIMESLFLVVGSEREIITLPVGRALSVKELYVTSPTGYVPFDRRVSDLSDHSHGVFSSCAMEKLRSYFNELGPKTTYEAWPEKIYLRRNSGTRKVINEPAIEKLLLQHGYVSIEPEKLTFLQQLELFKHVKEVISPTGAALSSAIACAPGTKIAVLMGRHKDMIYGYWNSLLGPLGVKVSYVLGRIDENHDLGIHGDFEMDIKDIKELLKSFGGQ